jgi:translation initiation factor RLI1
VDHIPRAIKGIVGEILTEKNENENKDYIMDMLDLANVTGRGVQVPH